MSSRPARPEALTPEQAAQLLTAAGEVPVTADDLRAWVAGGCPANADGSLNLVALGAWLFKEEAARGQD